MSEVWRTVTRLYGSVPEERRAEVAALCQLARPHHLPAIHGQPCVCGATSGLVPIPPACAGLLTLFELAGRSAPMRLEQAATLALGTRVCDSIELATIALCRIGRGELAHPRPWTAGVMARRIATRGRWVLAPYQTVDLVRGQVPRLGEDVVPRLGEDVAPGDVITWRRGLRGDLGVVERVQGRVWTVIRGPRSGPVYRHTDTRERFLGGHLLVSGIVRLDERRVL